MKKFSILLVFSIFFNCDKTIEKPEKFLEKDQMTNLLYDLSLFTSSQSFYERDSTIRSITAQDILNNYNLDSLSFAELNQFYIDQPKVYEQIFDTINKRFKKKIELTEALPQDPRDSIKKISGLKVNDLKNVLK